MGLQRTRQRIENSAAMKYKQLNRFDLLIASSFHRDAQRRGRSPGASTSASAKNPLAAANAPRRPSE